ncbi:MAG: hypothetical protein ACREK4_02975, partial [Candidatus Rokuibacteriota bacterium]
MILISRHDAGNRGAGGRAQRFHRHAVGIGREQRADLGEQQREVHRLRDQDLRMTGCRLQERTDTVGLAHDDHRSLR